MKKKSLLKNPYFWLAISLIYLFTIITFGFFSFKNEPYKITQNMLKNIVEPRFPPLNKVDYDFRLNELAHINIGTTSTSSLSIASTTIQKINASSTVYTASSTLPWPVKTLYPNDGAILPFKRIVAYYGNFYSKNMGILGQYPEDQMLSMLQAEVDKWNAADPSTPVLPALHYIAVTAQGYAGADGKYRLRMPDSQIDMVIAMAEKINGIVFLDVQVGGSTLEQEIPLLKKYLAIPQVNLGIDPEFSMKNGKKPGTVIGTFDAADINYTINYLAQLVKENDLPPKILIIHRFTEPMVTNYKEIETVPEVQIVMNMDGWGKPANKMTTYHDYIYSEPVQFTGFKLFYKNDTLASSTMMTPQDLLKLTPKPIYIQYQ